MAPSYDEVEKLRIAYNAALLSADEAFDAAEKYAREAFEMVMGPAREAYDTTVRPAREAYISAADAYEASDAYAAKIRRV
jgi:hypothetical protein